MRLRKASRQRPKLTTPTTAKALKSRLGGNLSPLAASSSEPMGSDMAESDTAGT